MNANIIEIASEIKDRGNECEVTMKRIVLYIYMQAALLIINILDYQIFVITRPIEFLRSLIKVSICLYQSVFIFTPRAL